MSRQFLRCFGPDVEVLPEPPKPLQAEDSYQGPARDRWGRDRCFRCGKPLYKNNKSHICTACQRKWGMPTLFRRVKPLQEWHRKICTDGNCENPSHWADCIPVRPPRPKRPAKKARLNAQGDNLPGAIPHTVLLDPTTAFHLEERASARSTELGCRIAKTDLIRQAVKEWIKNHPDTEFFVDA